MLLIKAFTYRSPYIFVAQAVNARNVLGAEGTGERDRLSPQLLLLFIY